MQAKCPTCNTLLNIPDHLVGKPVKCQCGKVFKCSEPKKQPVVTQTAKRSAAKNSFRITCPKCNKALNVEDKLLGQIVKCPCGMKLQTNAAAPSNLSPLAQSIADSGAAIRKAQTAALMQRQEEQNKSVVIDSRKNGKTEDEEEKFGEGYNRRGRKRKKNPWFLKIGIAWILMGLVAFGSFAGTQYLETSYNDWYSKLPDTSSDNEQSKPGFSSKESADSFFGQLFAALFGIVVIGGTLLIVFSNSGRRVYDGDGENDFWLGGDG